MKSLFISRAKEFICLFYQEKELSGTNARLKEIEDEIAETGTYTHTSEELEFGAKVAWRNSNRCIGRLFWKSLKVRDRRSVEGPEEIYEEVLEHIRFASNKGKIRSAITIFQPQHPDNPAETRIWNPQLIRYAAYPQNDGSILGDPAQLELTKICQDFGWLGEGTAFDILPLLIQAAGKHPQLFQLPHQEIMEVPIVHPRFAWFADLDLKWHAVPIISGMLLEIGGIHYPAAPFNGWYMLNEIASRNFGDEKRYNLLPAIARAMGLDTSQKTQLWKDRALLELNEAVLYSYQQAQVSIVDHHQAAEQFMSFQDRELEQGRQVEADWTWITPPMSSSSTPVFHQEWTNEVKSPNFYYNLSPWEAHHPEKVQKAQQCPFHAQKKTRNSPDWACPSMTLSSMVS